MIRYQRTTHTIFLRNNIRYYSLLLQIFVAYWNQWARVSNTFDFGNLKLDNVYLCHSKTKEIEEELNIPVSSKDIQAVNMLNDEQQYAYEIIYRRVTENARGCFFLDGPGGTEKTFLYATLLANLRIKGIICVAVTSSGIAAANLAGGRIANYRFKIPLDIKQNQRSQISKQSSLAELIRACKLIIWDEVPMAKRQSIEYFESTLRDVCSNNLLFGGKIVVFGGDFRQVLPVIPKSTLQEALNSSFVMSSLWPKLEKLHLTVNMRDMRDPAFSDFVLRVGDGSPPYENGKDIKLPRPIVISETEENVLIDRLIAAVYPDIHLINANPSLMTGRAILTPKNDDTRAINSILVSRQQGEAFTYKSFDEAADVATE
ncbi:ATP-dependent DNA helicase PIF1-like [Silene latifolia]|uniref:ATP-dependent DNA helicase PIF1-like n=1 Tax=Silene latifolia TaxID=37657 RepID=UPI003D77E6E4